MSRSPVQILVSGGAGRCVETDSAQWILYGRGTETVAQRISNDSRFRTIVEELSSRPGEHSLISVESDHGTTVRAYRGISSSFDIYWCERPSDGAVIIGDHFRNVLSKLPVDKRTVPSSVAGDHLLFGTRPQDTYIEEVGRLGHGESFTWPVGGEPNTELIETLSPAKCISPSEAKRRLDAHFTDHLSTAAFDEPVATMLSGGVDSTLLHDYLDTNASVSGAFDSPEFASEVEYAKHASEVLGSNHELVEFDERTFQDRVEATTLATGYPLRHLQTTLIHAAAAETPYRIYVSGEFADSLFGTGTAALAHLARYTGRFTALFPDLLPEVSELKTAARRLQYPATHPNGLAMGFSIHADECRVADVLSESIVRERKNERLRYVNERVAVGSAAKYADHMHLGHWISFLQGNTAALWRQAVHASGKEFVTPFADRNVLEMALALPAAKRYARFGRPTSVRRVVKDKYVLKELLERNCPRYDATKAKGSSGLPIERYFTTGPLVDAFDHRSMPAFVPKRKHEAVRRGADHLAWYAFSYAVWRDLVLENDDLGLFESTDVIEV